MSRSCTRLPCKRYHSLVSQVPFFYICICQFEQVFRPPVVTHTSSSTIVFVFFFYFVNFNKILRPPVVARTSSDTIVGWALPRKIESRTWHSDTSYCIWLCNNIFVLSKSYLAQFISTGFICRNIVFGLFAPKFVSQSEFLKWNKHFTTNSYHKIVVIRAFVIGIFNYSSTDLWLTF